MVEQDGGTAYKITVLFMGMGKRTETTEDRAVSAGLILVNGVFLLLVILGAWDWASFTSGHIHIHIHILYIIYFTPVYNITTSVCSHSLWCIGV